MSVWIKYHLRTKKDYLRWKIQTENYFTASGIGHYLDKLQPDMPTPPIPPPLPPLERSQALSIAHTTSQTPLEAQRRQQQKDEDAETQRRLDLYLFARKVYITQQQIFSEYLSVKEKACSYFIATLSQAAYHTATYEAETIREVLQRLEDRWRPSNKELWQSQDDEFIHLATAAKALSSEAWYARWIDLENHMKRVHNPTADALEAMLEHHLAAKREED